MQVAFNSNKEHSREEDFNFPMENEARQWYDKLYTTAIEIRLYLDYITLKVNIDDFKDEFSYLKECLQQLLETNDFHLKTCIYYRNKVVKARECDDIQCDDIYRDAHFLLQKRLEKHHKNVAELKQNFLLACNRI